MRDFLPEQARKKQFIEDFLRRLFERYGFEPLQTPIVEDFGLLSAKGSGGEAIKNEIYYFKDKGDRELGLRYDLTVPLARVVASNPNLVKPFKRYCIGLVYRYDSPQAMRYREFTQADVDIVGAKSVLSDFECVEIAVEAMRGLGFEFKVKVNNRQLLEDLAKKVGVKEEQIKEAFRAIDKLDKVGEKGVEKELRDRGIGTEILEQIKTNSLEVVKEKIPESTGLRELEELLSLCRENGLKEVVFDLSLARGLEYYTGNVFEVAVTEGPSVGGGGRYDKLIEVYGGTPTPAVGISFGVDRLLDALENSLAMGPNTDIFIAPISREALAASIKLASRVRALGFAAEVDLMERNIKKNLEYANKKGIPFFCAIGENELKSGKVKVKEMSTGKGKEFSFDEYAGLQEFLGKA